MGKYNLICMSFDGEYQRERIDFSTIDEAWEHSNNIGSKWYFYPFYFIATEKTIVAAPYQLEWLSGKRIKTVADIFSKCSQLEGAQGVDVDSFVDILIENNL